MCHPIFIRTTIEDLPFARMELLLNLMTADYISESRYKSLTAAYYVTKEESKDEIMRKVKAKANSKMHRGHCLATLLMGKWIQSTLFMPISLLSAIADHIGGFFIKTPR